MKIADAKQLFLAVLTIFAVLSSTAETKVKVYVTGDNISKEFKTIFASRLTAAISEVPGYTVMELNESFIDPMAEEHNRRSSDRNDRNSKRSSAEEKDGKFMANYMVMVELTNLFGETYATSHLTDVDAAKVIKAYDTTGKVENLSQLTALADNVANGLIKGPYREEQDRKEAEELEKNKKTETENRKKEAQERREQERARRTELRDKAVANLTPDGSFIFGDIIVLKDFSSVRFTSQSKEYQTPGISVYVPRGFKIADEITIRKLHRAGYLPSQSFITNNSIFTNGDYKSKSRQCGWEMTVLYVDDYHKSCYPLQEIVCWTKWNKGLTVVEQRTCYAVLIKQGPTEHEIENEMRRLENAGY